VRHERFGDLWVEHWNINPDSILAKVEPGALLGRYLLEHGSQLAQAHGQIDAIVVVPSGGQRPPPHPLENVITSLDVSVPIMSLLARGPGELNFRRSSVDGYILAGKTKPMRVLLVEDVFVTGARLFSAARALVDHRHTIVGTLVLARRVNQDWGECQEMWDRQAALGFDWSTSPLTMVAEIVNDS
jgi:hypothetical protein